MSKCILCLLVAAATVVSIVHGNLESTHRPLDIILCNDDGFETPLIQALFFALQDAGHNVVMSAPYGARSGTSAAIDFLRPIGPVTRTASPRGTIPAGAPAVGLTTLAPQQYYVDGAVTGAVLYGVDVLSRRIFGGLPDLVLSGPNEGQNVGLFSPHSGTVGAVVTTLNRGLPSIAVSADASEPLVDLVGDLMVSLIDSLPRDPTTGGLDLNSVGLNINFPKLDAGTTVADYEFVGAKIGIATNTVGLLFVEKLSDCPFAASVGLGNVALPGLCLAAPYTAAGYPADPSLLSEGNIIGNGKRQISVAVIEGTYQADADVSDEVLESLSILACPVAFTVYNAVTDAPVSGPIVNGTTVASRPCSINIEATPLCSGVDGSVTIQLLSSTGQVLRSRVERTSPYFLFGDNSKGDVFSGTIPAGSYAIRATVNGVTRPPARFTLGACV